MNWKVKALLQTAISKLPRDSSHDIYFAVQRVLGRLREVNPLVGFADALRLVAGIESTGGSVGGKVVLEVGTGRRVNVPIALWLCGAAETITVDVTRYLKPRLILEDLAFIRANQTATMAAFGERARSGVFQERFATLVHEGLDVAGLLDAARIRYIAPRDAQALPIADESVDYHVSNNVLEHIPPDPLRRVLADGKRVVRPGGLLVHRVDFVDHFSEDDDSISSINFLQYSDVAWGHYAGNVFNYHNRLRIDEFHRIVLQAGLVTASEEVEVDAAAVRLLEGGFPLDARFAGKPPEVNAAATALVMLARAPVPVSPPGGVARMSARVSG